MDDTTLKAETVKTDESHNLYVNVSFKANSNGLDALGISIMDLMQIYSMNMLHPRAESFYGLVVGGSRGAHPTFSNFLATEGDWDFTNNALFSKILFVGPPAS